MIKLRDYQQEALDSLPAYWRTGKRHPLIVAPCGAGKSLIISQFIKDAMQYDGTRVLMLCHKKELLEQDEAELRNIWPDAPTGFFSASVGRKDWDAPILFAGVQSFAKHAHKFEPFDVCLLDEAHLLPKSAQTQYGQTIATLQLMRPDTVFIGLTATHYRLDSGYLHKGDGALFDGIAYEIEVQRLIDADHLVPVVAVGGQKTADLTGVHRRGGEFVSSEMAGAFDDVLEPALDEVIARGQDRRAWILFCASVDHAHRARAYMREHGVSAELVTGETPRRERERIIEDFRANRFRCLVNVDVLTTGFNAPVCDLGALLRATDSVSLYVQIVGRLMRTYPGKQDALLLDFGGNVERHGPIDAPRIRDKSASKKDDQDAPAKMCLECRQIVHASVLVCPGCGHQFPPPRPQFEPIASGGAVLLSQIKPSVVQVDAVTYHRHQKPGKPDSVCVAYRCGLRTYREWWMPEHGGPATIRTAQLLAMRYRVSCPATTDELLDLCDELPEPHAIEIKPDKQFERVTRAFFINDQEAIN